MSDTSREVANVIKYKTGLQPVSRPVEQVHKFEGWVEGTESLWAKALQTDNHSGLAAVPDP